MSGTSERSEGLLDSSAATLLDSAKDIAVQAPDDESLTVQLSPDQLLALPVDELELSAVARTLDGSTSEDRRDICVSLLSRDIQDVSLVRGIIGLGLAPSPSSLDSFVADLSQSVGGQPVEEDVEDAWKSLEERERGIMEKELQLRSMQRKLEAWTTIFPVAGASGITTNNVGPCMAPVSESGVEWRKDDGIVEVEVDDPWAESEEADDDIEDPWNDAVSHTKTGNGNGDDSVPALIDTGAHHMPSGSDEAVTESESPLQLSTFLQQSILQSALDFAGAGFLPGLAVLRVQYSLELFPYRLSILSACPEWLSAADLAGAQLLPVLGKEGKEEVWKESSPRDAKVLEMLEHIRYASDAEVPLAERLEPMATSAVEGWYRDHILSLDSLGLVDVQLAWVQQAESHGITGLDELGEDLSLLSRLVYDSSLTPEQNDKWSVESWHAANPTEIIAAYLSNSTASGIVWDIKTRVMPYLYVLESRAERAGRPDPTLIERYLSDTILSLPLDLSLPIFENSKATLGKNDRIIKDDMTVARLALACLYGSDQRDVWGVMSAIFECLPVWELSGRNPEDDAELTATTVDSIATFIRPTASQPRPPQASDLMMFFKPLPFASLSRALDILDVHLESGEILARWDVPVQLRFLLQSSRDGKEQVELAERMVRTAASSGVRAGLRGAEKLRLNAGGGDEGKWARLWDDMLRLNGSGDQLLRGAFGMVDGGELMRVYLGGLLRSGKLDMARKTVRRLESEHSLKPETLEAVVLATSRELYEGAETGNIHTGDMKTAYDCLNVAPHTPAIQIERSFIEATSRLSTFSLPSLSPHGGSLTPQEIRHTKNRLDLLSSVLSHSADAFRHEEMLLDLANKLGLSSRTQHGRVWGMMAARAAAAGEWETGDEYTVKAAEVVREAGKRKVTGQAANRKKASDPEAESSEFARLKQDVWRTALVIGSAADYSDITRKLDLLGLAIELCPAADVGKVLEAWRRVEDGRIKLDAAAKRRRIERIPGSNSGATRGHRRGGSTTSSSAAWASPQFDLPDMLPSAEERVLGSRTAARAAKMAFDIGGRLGSRLPPIQLPNLPRPASPATPIGAALSRTDSRNSQRGRDGSAQGQGQGQRGSASVQGGRSDSADRAGEGRFSGEYSRALDAISRLGGGAESEGERDGGQLGMDDVERVRRGASRALRQGVGWLLGADEREQG